MNSLLINTFLDLVKIDSPSGEEERIVSFILNYLGHLPFTPSLDSYGNIIVSVNGKGERILLSAHVDTVEPGRGVKPVITDGVIRSSGDTILGADNKVGVAILLTLLSELSTLVEEKRPSLDIVFTLSEEVGNYGAVNLDYSLITAKKGYTFDNPNPIGTIITAAPFYDRFNVKLIGKSAHASKPEIGINALLLLHEILGKIKVGKVSETAAVNIGVISGGSVRNTIPGELLFQGEVRSFYEEEIDRLSAEIKSVVEEVTASHSASAEIEIVRENGGYFYEENDSEISYIQSVMKEMGMTPVLKPDWGCADANIFVEHGIQAINLGDGTFLTHTTEEYVSIKDMETLNELVAKLIKISI